MRNCCETIANVVDLLYRLVVNIEILYLFNKFTTSPRLLQHYHGLVLVLLWSNSRIN